MYDLHCHLDGSLSEECIKNLAQEAGISIDGKDLSKELRTDENCESLAEYLTKFDLPLKCLVSENSFTKAVLDVMKTAAKEHVVYMEIRFAPMLSVTENFSASKIIEGALKGLSMGRERYGIDGNLILCGMRHMPVEVNTKLVETAAEYYGYGVCAVDLAGNEAAFPVRQQEGMFQKAKELGIPFTIHAGECGSAQSIWDAIELGASRIGHGIAAAKDENLMRYCAEHEIPFEMCPVSNLQTKAVRSMEEYPFLKFLETGIPITINTDNRTVSNTSLTKEIELLQGYYGIGDKVIEKLMENARRAAFR